jgi:hypothetical protein
MSSRWALAALAALVGAAGCNAWTARRYLTVEAHLEEGAGGVDLPVAPHVGVNVGRSLFVTGKVSNHHPARSATRLELVVKLYRHGESLKAKHEYVLHDVRGLDRIPPGGTAAFEVYLKETLRGYERVDVQVLGADFVP